MTRTLCVSVPVEYCQYIHIKAKSYPDMTQNVHVYIGVSMEGTIGCSWLFGSKQDVPNEEHRVSTNGKSTDNPQ